MTDKARILIFTGDGKGKTTAALGMAMRASGHDMKVFIIQFVKQSETGEIVSAARMENIRFEQAGLGFVPQSGSREFAKHKKAAKKGLALTQEAIESSDYDLIILDEVCVAVNKGLLNEKDVAEVIFKAEPKISLVLTGRGATAGLIDLADTVTEMRCVKHGMNSGTPAQRGVEL